MRNNEESEPDVLFKSSHILRGEILSNIVDHVQQPILGILCLKRGIMMCITSLRHYMKVTRFLEPTTYKRRAMVHFPTCHKRQRTHGTREVCCLCPYPKMTFIIPSSKVDYPVTICWTGDNGRKYQSDYWEGPIEEGLPVLGVDITSYIQHMNWNLIEDNDYQEASSVASVNQGDLHSSRKRKRVNSDEGDKPEAKKIQQGCPSTDDEELRRKLRHPDEGPSRWGGCSKEVEIIDLTTSDSGAEKDGDDESIDDEDDEGNDDNEDEDEDDDEDEEEEDDEPKMKTDPTYSPRGRALSEWDPEFWHGF